MKKNKKLVVAEKLFDELPPSHRSPETYRAIALAAKVKPKVIDEQLALAEKMSARMRRTSKRRPHASTDGF